MTPAATCGGEVRDASERVVGTGLAEVSIRTWPSRRAELLGLLTDLVYGPVPHGETTLTVRPRETGAAAFGGAGRRYQLDVEVATAAGRIPVHVLVHVPVGDGPWPVVVAPNFYGNHATTPEPGVPAVTWRSGRTDVPTGAQSPAWPYETVLARGYAVATFHYEQLEEDLPIGERPHGLRDIHPVGGSWDSWSAVGAWAWGASRVREVVAGLPGVDGSRSAVLGHSRLGKAALWAAACDEGFAAVISNNSGCMGAALHRHPGGETLGDLVGAYPHWFRPGLARYAGREHELPYDQHELLALVHPRAVHVASAADDAWADPDGEEAAVGLASPLWASTPAGSPGHARLDRVSHHRRAGGHGVTAEDWHHYLDFLDAALAAPQRGTACR